MTNFNLSNIALLATHRCFNLHNFIFSVRSLAIWTFYTTIWTLLLTRMPSQSHYTLVYIHISSEQSTFPRFCHPSQNSPFPVRPSTIRTSFFNSFIMPNQLGHRSVTRFATADVILSWIYIRCLQCTNSPRICLFTVSSFSMRLFALWPHTCKNFNL